MSQSKYAWDHKGMARTYLMGDQEIAIEKKTGKVHYRYWAVKKWFFGFDCTMFCMVGEPWKRYFKEVIDQHNLKIELFDDGKDIYDRCLEVASASC